MQTYQLSQASIRRSLRRIWIFAGSLLVVIVGLSAVMAASTTAQTNGLKPRLVDALIQTGVIMLAMLVVLAFLMSWRERKRLNALRIAFGKDRIKLSDGVRPEVEIRRRDVTGFEETAAGLRILAESPRRQIVVSTGLEQYEEIKAGLDGWMPASKP